MRLSQDLGITIKPLIPDFDNIIERASHDELFIHNFQVLFCVPTLVDKK